MFDDYKDVVEVIGTAIDIFGVLVIAIGVVISAIIFIGNTLKTSNFNNSFRQARRHLGRTLLLGLEVLVAADIIKTVAIDQTLESLAALGLLVLIRTFLSTTLEMETDGKWPWQRTGD